jgi:hypothetical protein
MPYDYVANMQGKFFLLDPLINFHIYYSFQTIMTNYFAQAIFDMPKLN